MSNKWKEDLQRRTLGEHWSKQYVGRPHRNTAHAWRASEKLTNYRVLKSFYGETVCSKMCKHWEHWEGPHSSTYEMFFFSPFLVTLRRKEWFGHFTQKNEPNYCKMHNNSDLSALTKRVVETVAQNFHLSDKAGYESKLQSKRAKYC